ncbi:MAG: hypothetical protein NTY61_02315, partial [Candidatus Parcubacteria bacterium]|nr:hypothetical protein [Candidatus Parcubacteria bacterium]
KSQLTSQSFEQEDGFGMLGAALGLQLLENTKPTIKEQFLKGIDSWFTVPTEEAEQIADENEVGVKISGPESANSGDKVVYLVKYQNKKKVAINNVSLNVRYPVGLAVGDVKPSAVVKVNSDENSDSNSIVKEDNWEVGTLEPEQSGQTMLA